MDNNLLKVQNVTKVYRLGMIGGTTLREDLQRLKAKILKQEDPTRKIGEKGIDPALIGSRFKALDHVSFEVKPGEAVGIIGHNGAGKSTLLKLITRITAPTEGWIGLNGRITSMLEVGTGFHPELTGRENIYMNGAILGMSRKEIDKKIDEIIEFSEVSKFIDTPVKRYSSGMYVKLAFSVAAHLDSEIIIMDEVLAVGDMAFQKKCIDKMRKAANEEHRTILYVSHNMSTIRQLCSRVIVMDHGKVIFDGDVDKGISIYLGNSRNSETKRDLSSIERLSFLKKKDLRLLSAEYLGKETNLFRQDEPINLRLSWINNTDIKNIGFRFVVYGIDDSHLCASFKYDIYTGQKNHIVNTDLSLDLHHLAPGDYQSHYVFFYSDEFGVTEDIDQVKGLDFTIDDSHKSGVLPWRTAAWGHFELPELEVVQIQEEKA